MVDIIQKIEIRIQTGNREAADYLESILHDFGIRFERRYRQYEVNKTKIENYSAEMTFYDSETYDALVKKLDESAKYRFTIIRS